MGVQVGEDRGRRVAADRLAALATVQRRGARIQQLQVIVQLGHGADRRTRAAHRVGLVDRDGGRDAGDRVDLRAIHAIEELPRVRRERLDVAALAFRIERVEHQRRLAAAGHAGDDRQLAERQVEIDVAKIVLSRAADADRVVGSGRGHPPILRGGHNAATL
ncbi:ABC transporter ATP-binding protein [bacterium]|nr:MAG: ABC transporter ATP-binding protein [bacterium]